MKILMATLLAIPTAWIMAFILTENYQTSAGVGILALLLSMTICVIKIVFPIVKDKAKKINGM